MSYEIIYDKQFIKVSEDKFVPMIQGGCNNLFEYNNRRVRSWFPYSIKGKSVLTLEEMIAYAMNMRKDIINRDEGYEDKAFGYWTALAINGTTHNTTFGQFKGIFVTGCKKALTVEQLGESNVGVFVKNSYYTSEAKEKHRIEAYSKCVGSGQELLDAIAECNERFKDTGIIAIVEYSGMHEEKPKRLRKQHFPKAPKKIKNIIEVDEYFTIKVGDDYLVKRTRNGYKYTSYPYLRYRTKKEAQVKINGYNKKYSTEHTIERVKEKGRVSA